MASATNDIITSDQVRGHDDKVIDKKYRKICCSEGTCQVANFKPPCCMEIDNGEKPRCYQHCALNNPFCHDTLCCECHNTIIYHHSIKLEGMKKKSYVCGGCGYRVCYKCLSTIEIKRDEKSKNAICPKCDFYW